MNKLSMCKAVDDAFLGDKCNLTLTKNHNTEEVKIEGSGNVILIYKIGALFSVEINGKQFESDKVAMVAALSPYFGKRLIISLFG